MGDDLPQKKKMNLSRSKCAVCGATVKTIALKGHMRDKHSIELITDEQYLALLKRENGNLGNLVRQLQEENQNLIAALCESTKLSDELHEKVKAAKGHLNLYRLFSCEGGDSYDPECAELNLDKVMEILK